MRPGGLPPRGLFSQPVRALPGPLPAFGEECRSLLWFQRFHFRTSSAHRSLQYGWRACRG